MREGTWPRAENRCCLGLVSLCPVYLIGSSLNITLYEIAQKTMKFDTVMVGLGKTSDPKASSTHPKVAAVFL